MEPRPRTHRDREIRVAFARARHVHGMRLTREDLLRARRPSPATITVGGDSIVLKDQPPLVAANVSLVTSWQFDDFVEYLNDHVYFLPGDTLSQPAGQE
jgi:hypothetical protein